MNVVADVAPQIWEALDAAKPASRASGCRSTGRTGQTDYSFFMTGGGLI
jgi:hypothetical protein